MDLHIALVCENTVAGLVDPATPDTVLGCLSVLAFFEHAAHPPWYIANVVVVFLPPSLSYNEVSVRIVRLTEEFAICAANRPLRSSYGCFSLTASVL